MTRRATDGKEGEKGRKVRLVRRQGKVDAGKKGAGAETPALMYQRNGSSQGRKGVFLHRSFASRLMTAAKPAAAEAAADDPVSAFYTTTHASPPSSSRVC